MHHVDWLYPIKNYKYMLKCLLIIELNTQLFIICTSPGPHTRGSQVRAVPDLSSLNVTYGFWVQISNKDTTLHSEKESDCRHGGRFTYHYAKFQKLKFPDWDTKPISCWVIYKLITVFISRFDSSNPELGMHAEVALPAEGDSIFKAKKSVVSKVGMIKYIAETMMLRSKYVFTCKCVIMS